jgi:hypothetical protein
MFVWQPIFFDRCHPCEKDEKKEVKENVREKLFGRLGIALLGLKLKFNPRSIWVNVKSSLPTYLCMSVCLSIRPSVACPFVHLSVCPFVCSFHLSVSPSFRLSVRPSVCQFVCLSVCPSTYLSVCPSVCLSICLSILIRSLLRITTCLSTSLFVCLFVCP